VFDSRVPSHRSDLQGVPHFKMNSRYQRLHVVGRGSFGCCWLVENASGDQQILKQIDVSQMSDKQWQEAANEVRVLSTLKHPYIIKYRESFVEGGLLCIVTDYAERGSLYTTIHMQRRVGDLFPEELVLLWFVQLSLALKHLHDRRILHRDLKTQNIFLTGQKSGTVKLGDFGIARVLQHTQDCAKTAIGTPYYLSPEICREQPYNYKSDIWSLGCVLFELATLQHAFDAQSMRGLIMKILKGMHPPLPSNFSSDLKGLVRDILVKDPILRPSIDEVLRKPMQQATIQRLLQEVQVHQMRSVHPNQGCGMDTWPQASHRNPTTDVRGGTPACTNRASSCGKQAARKAPREQQHRQQMQPPHSQRGTCKEDSRPGGGAQNEDLDSSARTPRTNAVPWWVAPRRGSITFGAGASFEEPIRDRSAESVAAWLEADCVPPGDPETLELIGTLQEGLAIKQDDHCQEASGGSRCAMVLGNIVATFLRPDGRVLHLPVGERDSISYKIEALKVYLEQEVGFHDFLAIYRYLEECVQAAIGTGTEPRLPLAPREAVNFLPLVHQLLVCEDICFNSN